ncbi:MAG: class I SAM-dependent methyltransferase [Bacteroidetes bacterium]|nr:class I SAM-dependent methyltransferase [Bacteroidota bacterium]
MQNAFKQHWENIYTTKTPEQVSWTQEMPETSIAFLEALQLPKDASILDVGGGDSKFADYLLKKGFTNISVLDISEKSIERAKNRLGNEANKIHWINSNILDFQPSIKYDLWHDRAAFHFLTEKKEIDAYVQLASKFAKNLVIGTFSVDGPFKCSGLEITQYDENKMKDLFQTAGFQNTECKRVVHTTPFGSTQNFVFCGFVKRDLE